MPQKIKQGLTFSCLLGSVVLLAGCRTYWPMDKRLAERLEAESVDGPLFTDDEAVEALGRQVAVGELPPPTAWPVPADWTLRDYIEAALGRNPGIAAAVHDAQMLGLRVPQVTSLRDPMLLFVPPTGDMSETAAGMMGGSLGLSQNVPWPGKLIGRGRVIEAAVRVALENLRARRLAVIARTQRAYAQYYLADASLKIMQEHTQLLDQIHQVAAARYRSGLTAQQDLLRTEVELYNLDNEVITLGQQRTTTTAMLNMLMNRAVTASLPPPQAFDADRTELKIEELLEQATANNPQLAALRQRIAGNLEMVRLARLNYLPDFQVGFTYTWISSMGLSPVANGDNAWNLGLGFTLPIWWGRIRSGVLEQNAAVLGSVDIYTEQRNATLFGVQDALVRVDTQYRNAVLLRDSILPRARQTVAVSEQQYRAGRLEFITWIDNWRQLLRLALQYHQAVAGLWRDLASLEQLVGAQLQQLPQAHQAAGEPQE